MKPYKPPINGRASYDGLLLDFNERTTGPADAVVFSLRQFGRDQKIQLYPEYFDLPDKIAAYAQVDSSQVMITNGTDQAIDVIFRTFSGEDDTIIIPVPTFSMYAQYAQINGNKILSPLYSAGDLDFPLKDVLDAINDSVKVIVVCNPNNPTGTLLPVAGIERIAKKAKDAIVYVDEAYYEFSGVSAVNLIGKYPNIIVSRTFSKAFGLAGLRIGYVVANNKYISEMLKVRGPYDVNQLACLAGTVALTNVQEVESYAVEVMKDAKPLLENFFLKNNIKFFHSAGNFILFKPDNAKLVADTLRRSGIAVRPQDKPNIKGTLRVTIGTRPQMQAFIGAYQNLMRTSYLQKYALVDRDGTLIYEPPDSRQVDSLKKLRILDGAVEGLKRLQDAGYQLVMVSNQDGLDTPLFPLSDFEPSQNAMLSAFAKAGVAFEQVFICPHKSQDKCACRKPKTGLVDDWLKTARLDTKQSFVCGDRASDKGLARNLGLPFVSMIKNGNFEDAIKERIAK